MLTPMPMLTDVRFFRDKSAFNNLAKLIDYKVRPRPGCELSLWCCGCAGGQDAYSLAILCEELRASGLNFAYRIYASEGGAHELSQARSGLYSQAEVQQGIAASRLEKWFVKAPAETGDKTSWQVKDVLRSRIEFSTFDLRKPVAMKEVDIIISRNVLAPFSMPEKEGALAFLGSILKPDGYLVLGHKESLDELSSDFYPVVFEKSTFYQYDRSLALAESLQQEQAS